MTDITASTLAARDRAEAARQAWREVESGDRNRPATRGLLKEIAWDMRGTPDEVRFAVLELLMSDQTAEGQADSLRLAGLLLPVERDRQITALLATRAVDYGWASLTPALVRSLARPALGDVDDLGRSEAAAIRSLNPGREVVEVVFGVFLDPKTDPGPGELRLDERARSGAWDLLGRIDSDGAQRTGMLLSLDTEGLSPESRIVVEDMRAAAADLRTIPRTAAELRWLRSIREKVRGGDDSALGWWADVRDAANGLSEDQRSGLAMRHLEAIRLASQRSPEWLSKSRAQAVAELKSRLEDRPRYQRRSDQAAESPLRSQRVSDFQDELVWADCLTIALIDEAMGDTSIRERIFQLVDLDHEDRSTEFGGTIADDGEGGVRVALYPPRQRDRTSDTRFVASEDMIRDSDFVLAHFHFHAQRRDSKRYAGPSSGDLNYAALSGRTNVVLTSIKANRLNPDVYQPNRVTIDLGDLDRP